MTRVIITLLLACSVAISQHAQTISRTYQQESLSKVLKDISASSKTYKINFIYNELEDFTVTTTLRNVSILNAVKQVVGYYPIHIAIDSTMVFVECTNKAKHKFSGRIVNEKGLPLEYANIALLSPIDSTFITGGVSNRNGDFVIPCEYKHLLARVSYVGYKTAIHKFTRSDVGNVVMRPDSYHLNSVTVEGIHRTDHVDHSVFTFTPEQIKQSRHSCDLLGSVPGLILDIHSGSVKKISGGNVTILLNGNRASEQELRLIPANKVKNVVYYHFAPTKYANSDGTVINVVTYRLDNGYAVDLGANTAVTTGFVNAYAGAQYNHGYNQVSVNANLNVRNYNEWVGKDWYRFRRNDGSTSDYTYRDSTRFGYTDNNIQAKFSRAIADDYTLQIAFKTSLSHNFNNSKTIIDAQGDERWNNGNGQNKSETDILSPSLDIYFSKALPRNQELSVNIVGTHYNNSKNTANRQFAEGLDSPILDDRIDQSNKKNSIIGDFNYSKRWSDGKYSFDIRYLSIYSHSNSILSNMLSDYTEYEYWSNHSYNAVFADFCGSLWRWNYRIGGKLLHVYNGNVDNSQSVVQVSPRIILSKNLNKHNNVRISLQSWPTSPSISQLSTNASQIIPGLLSQGNPFLKSAQVYSLGVSHGYYTNMFALSTWANAQYSDSPINRYYEWRNVKGNDYIVSSFENAKRSWNSSANVQATYRPFNSELLVLSLYLSGNYTNTDSRLTGKYSKWNFPVTYSIRFRKGNFGVSYQGGYTGWSLGGTTLSKNENTSNIEAYWQHGNLRIMAQCLWLFTRSKYANEILPNPVIKRSESHRINDNASMFTIGFSWNIFSGKRLNVNKKLNNSDNDSGLL